MFYYAALRIQEGRLFIIKPHDIVKEIRRVQQKRDLTDEKIAFYAGLSKGTVSQLLRGNSRQFTLQTIIKIAKALDCRLDITFHED